jgi:alpha-galactosidase
MWAMLAAPLLAGNDLPNMKPQIVSILTNKDVIAIDQDKLGHQATRVYSDGEVEVWSRKLSGGAVAIAVLNAGSDRYATHPFKLDLAKLGLHGAQTGKNLWTGQDVELNQDMPIEIPSHDIVLVRIAAPK